MDHSHYLELSSDPIRFESVSQLTSVFFDDANKQVFAVRSGGTTGIVVKGLTDNANFTFCMENKGPMKSIKFSPDMKILAVQRTELCVEFVPFTGNQPNVNETITYKSKNSEIYGFVWLSDREREVVFISNSGIELHTINLEKKQLKLVKSMNQSVNWFSWCSSGNFVVIASNGGALLTPLLLKQSVITKLPKLELENDRPVPERDLTVGIIYGTLAVLTLIPAAHRLVEVVIYLLNGPGLAPKKTHVLRLGHVGRYAINIVDDLVIVHHQTTKTSLIFDIALKGEVENGISYHTPITPGKAIKPFSLKLPSLSLDGHMKSCELYSPNWVLFQPNIVIDAKLGCLWKVNLKLEELCKFVTDRVQLVELLLQRTNAKPLLLDVLREMVTIDYDPTMLAIIADVFDRLNAVYESWVTAELHNQTAQPSTAKQTAKLKSSPRVLIDQNDMFVNIFSSIGESSFVGKILVIYLTSLAKYNIAAQHDISKMVIVDLVRSQKYSTLQKLISLSLINESKPLACFLLSMSTAHPSVTQMAIDMLHKLKAHSIIIEVLIGQGRIIEALRLASKLSEKISARKYLEAAKKTNDPLVFYSVYTWFQQHNIRLRGSPDFPRTEMCEEYVHHFQRLYC